MTEISSSVHREPRARDELEDEVFVVASGFGVLGASIAWGALSTAWGFAAGASAPEDAEPRRGRRLGERADTGAEESERLGSGRPGAGRVRPRRGRREEWPFMGAPSVSWIACWTSA